MFDLILVIPSLVLISPLMGALGVLVWISVGRPIFFSQERPGKGGKPFVIYKFRTMLDKRDGSGDLLTDDARLTRIGRFLRSTSLDELPELFNVLKGDMSLVGPRPERPFFVAQLTRDIPYYAVRHTVKPGITGWAQVKYQYGSSVDDSLQKLQYDLYYVKNNSLFLDVVILVETVRVVLTGQGAQ